MGLWTISWPPKGSLSMIITLPAGPVTVTTAVFNSNCAYSLLLNSRGEGVGPRPLDGGARQGEAGEGRDEPRGVSGNGGG